MNTKPVIEMLTHEINRLEFEIKRCDTNLENNLLAINRESDKVADTALIRQSIELIKANNPQDEVTLDLLEDELEDRESLAAINQDYMDDLNRIREELMQKRIRLRRAEAEIANYKEVIGYLKAIQ